MQYCMCRVLNCANGFHICFSSTLRPDYVTNEFTGCHACWWMTEIKWTWLKNASENDLQKIWRGRISFRVLWIGCRGLYCCSLWLRENLGLCSALYPSVLLSLTRRHDLSHVLGAFCINSPVIVHAWGKDCRGTHRYRYGANKSRELCLCTLFYTFKGYFASSS